MDRYYNTTRLARKDLDLAIRQAKNQDEIILCLFVKYHHPLTPSEVHGAFFTKDTPLTSIRRSMSNLTKAGYLVKTDTQVDGRYGRPEYRWNLATRAPVQEKLL